MRKAKRIEYSKVDVAKFLKRKGITQQDLAKKINCSLGLVGGWASYRGVPSYEKCMDLLRAGMTVSELFGEEIAKEARFFPITEKDLITEDGDFKIKVADAIIELMNEGFFKLNREV